MKLIFTFVIFIFVFILGETGYSQGMVANEYSFTSYIGIFEPLTNPTNLVTGTFDDQTYEVNGLPSFDFNGLTYNDMTVHSNGSVAIGVTGLVGPMYMPISNNNNCVGVIAPLARDLQNVDGNSTISWAIVGPEIVVEWLGAKRFTMTGESFDFQMRLDTLTGTIRFVYGSFTGVVSTAGDPQVGLRGATNVDFNNRSVTSDLTWATSAQGLANNATCRMNSTLPLTAPISGLTFQYSACEGVVGCMDIAACNYDAEATCSGGECVYCGCGQTICGCMDSTACNYNFLATYDSGVCSYDCYGCTDAMALNYDVAATIDDGSCIQPGMGWACYAAIPMTCADAAFTGNTQDVVNDNPASANVDCGLSSNTCIWYAYVAEYNSTVTLSTEHPASDFDTYLSVYTGTCDYLYCYGTDDDGGEGFLSMLTFEAMAGEVYLIRVSGFANQMGNFGLTMDCGGGCLDEAACNYEPEAPFDNGSCIYGIDCYGCTDSDATNYDPVPVYDNGSCLYITNVIVYYDMNQNGSREWDEPGMANWPIYIGGLQATIFTNANGQLDIAMPASPYVLELVNETDNWISSSPTTMTIAVPDAMNASFGLIPDNEETFFLSGPYNGFWDIINCTSGMEDGIFLSNTGSVPIHGTITLMCDEFFTPEIDVYGTIAPDQIAAGYAQWNIGDFLPGQSQLFSFHIDGPGVEYLGETFTFYFEVELVDEFGEVFFTTEYITSMEVACAYDPNDLSADPIGYAEPHYTLPAERIQYRVRFQNTGNLPAEDVVIVDDLDPTIFNMSTFEPMYGSASFTSCLHDDGTLDFIFNDIFLPDSTSDEEGSHGFVVFNIELQPGLAPGTIVNNLANIYFEQNPPITTNTVFHTIFDCGSFVVPSIADEICSNTPLIVDNTQDYVESYQWLVDGEVSSSESTLEVLDLSVGEHLLQWAVWNPLCGLNESYTVLVNPTPSLELPSAVAYCAGAEVLLNATSNGTVIWNETWSNGTSVGLSEPTIYTAIATSADGCMHSDEWAVGVLDAPGLMVEQNSETLTATDGVEWQWYQNGSIMEGETSSTLIIPTEGIYNVMITGANGCSAMSEAILISDVNNVSTNVLSIYPHPIVDVAVLIMPTGTYEVKLLNALGQVVAAYGKQKNRMEIRFEGLSAGVYFVQLKNETQTFTMKTIVK